MHIVLVSPLNWSFPTALSKIENHTISVFHSDEESLSSLMLDETPDLVFLGGFNLANDNYFDKVVAMSIANPTWLVVPFLQDSDFTYVLRAMRKGIREILASQTKEEIDYIISRAQAHATRREQMSERRKELVKTKKPVTRVGIVSAKGGDGGSAITANIATSISQNKNIRVVLLDLSMELGDLDLYLIPHKPIDNLIGILSAIDRLDNTLLKIMIHHCSDNLDFIAAPDTMEDVFKITASGIERLIDFLSVHYDFVIIDMGTGLNPIIMRIWTKINKFILVSTLSVGSARRAAQIISLRSKINSGDSKSNVLLNKVGFDSDIPQSDYEAAIGQKIWKAIPYDVDIDAAILAGSSLVKTKKHSKFTRAVTDIASEMTDISNNVSHGFMESLWTTFKNK